MPIAGRNDPLAISFSLFVVGSSLIYGGISGFRKRRKMEDAARIDIGSAPQGLVEVEGYAWPSEHSMKAVCRRSVVYYNYKVQKYVKRGKNSSWETKHEFSFQNPFYVIDSSGACLVHPAKHSMEVTESITKLSSYAETVAELAAIIDQKGTGLLSWIGSQSLRLVEKKILVGSPVYVCGNMQSALNNTAKIKGDYRKFLERVKLINNNPIFRLQRFDKNRDGKVCDAEMLSGLSETSKELSNHLEENIKIAGVIANSEAHSMILGDCHQEALIKRVSSWVYLKMIGGVLLIGAGVFIFQNAKR